MYRDSFKRGPFDDRNRRGTQDPEWGNEILARFGETLAPLVDRFGEEAINTIVMVMARIVQDDWQAALSLLEKSPAIVESLSATDENLVLKIYGLADQVLPHGSALAARFIESSPSILAVSDYDTLARTAGLACVVARSDTGTALALLDQCPAILERVGFDGLERVGNFVACLAAATWTNAMREVSRTPGRIDSLLEAGGVDLALSAYDLAARVASADWSRAIELVEKTPLFAATLAKEGETELVAPFLKDAGALASISGKLASAYLERAPGLMRMTGPDLFRSFKNCLLLLADRDPGEALAFLQAGPDFTSRLLAKGSREIMIAVLDEARKLAETWPSTVHKYLIACASPNKPSTETALRLAEMTDQLARTAPATAKAFLETVPALIPTLTMDELERAAELGRSMNDVSSETTVQLFHQAPALVDRVGIAGLELIGRFSMRLALESWSTAKQLLEKCPSILDAVLPLGPPSIMKDLCSLGGRTAAYNARIAVSLLENSAPIMRLVGYEGLERMEELVHRVGAESWTTAVSLLQTSPAILERVGFEGLERIADTALAIARENNYGAVSLVEASPDRIDRIADIGTPDLALHVYDLAREAAAISWRLAAALVDKSPRLATIGGPGILDGLALLMKETAEKNWRVATRALDLSNVIIESIGFEGFQSVTRLAVDLAGQDEPAAMAMVEKSPAFIGSLMGSADQTTVLAVYGHAMHLSKHDPALAQRFLDKSPYFLEWGGLEGLGMIGSFLDATAKEDLPKALSFLETEHPEFTDFMENIPRGLELKSVTPVLSTYLKALLGRPLEIAAGSRVSTDGRTILLPRRVREFRDDHDNFTYYKVIATHQEAHLEYGTFELETDRLGRLVDSIGERYGTEFLDGENELERFVALFPEPDMARDLFNLLEDYRINATLKREYPALGAEVDRMNGHELKKRHALEKMTGHRQRTVEALGRLCLGRKEFSNLEVDPDLLEEFRRWLAALEEQVVTVDRTAEATAELYRAIDERYDDSYRTVRPSSEPPDHNQAARNMGSFGKTSRLIEEALRSREAPGQGSPRGQEGGQQEARSGEEGDRRPTDSRPGLESIDQRPHSSGEDQRSYRGTPGQGGRSDAAEQPRQEEPGPAGGASLSHDREKIERLLRSVHKERGITPRDIERRLESLNYNEIYIFLHNLEESLKKKTELESEGGTTLYSEWGDDIQGYRPNWARVREQVHPGTSLDFYRNTLNRHGGLMKKIRREFQMLRPEAHARLKGRYDGDDIDLDAVVSYLVDRKAGLATSEKNYILTDRRKRDIAVAFLVDMSKSTQGATIEREKESLIIMSEALHEVGDTFAVFGFSGNNRDNVDFYTMKDFDEPYNDRAKKRISSIEHHYENRDGAAIRHVTGKLRRRPERTKLIVLLSDGKPVDKEYGGTYAIEDTRMALREARHFGINAFCITVDRSAPEYLPRMYSHSRWTVIDDVARLPEKITRIYRSLTA